MSESEGPAVPFGSGVLFGRFAALVLMFVLGVGGTLLYQNRSRIWSRVGFRSGPPALVLIGLDGADWNLLDPLIEAGKMPHLARLVQRGARARLLTIAPILSPVIWTSIATGVKPERHGIIDFTAIKADTGEAIPVTSNLRRVPALWNRFSDAGLRVGFVAWWASFPAESVNGYIVSDRVAYQLGEVKATPDDVGKMSPSEGFAQIVPLIVDPKTVPDSMIARFFEDPTVLSTEDPEEKELLRQFRIIVASGESYRRIAAKLAKTYSPNVESVYFEGTDTVAHLFMRFRPPALPGVPPSMVRRFGGVIDRYYQYADELVGEIVGRHGETANYVICSDHGFKSDQDRPLTTDSRIDRGRAADWHRKYGMLVVSGPAARAGTKIREATILDITPTMLALARQPIPPNLDGRVLVDALSEEFLREHPLRSLEETPADGQLAGGPAKGGSGSPDAPVASAADEEIRQRLISLGYLTQESNNAHNNRGIMLLGRGEFDRAIAEFQAAMTDNPRFAAGLVNMARAYWSKGDDASAVAKLRQAGTISPEMREVPLMLGNIALKAGDLAAAETQFLKALEIEPNDTDTLNCLGLVHDARQDWEKAELYFRKAIAVDSDYSESYNNLGNVAKKKGDAAQAETWYLRAIEADPFFMGAYANLALVYQERGELDRAADLYRQALEKDNANPDLQNNLGSLLFRRNDLPGAETAFRRAIAIDKKYAEGHNSLGVVQGAQGKDLEEKASYEKAIELKPRYEDAIYNLGLWHVRHGDDKSAERLLREAVRLRPDYASALGTLAGLRLRSGDAAGARVFVERALALQPNNPRWLTLFGEASARMGDKAAAVKALRRSLEIQPAQQDAQERLKALGG